MKTILIVDNEPSNLDVLTITMEMEGYMVATLPDGKGFIKLVREMQPDLIILDIELGEHDGRLLCQELKSLDVTKHIPVIIVSASSETKIGSAYEYGADCVILKPFDIDELLKETKSLLNK
ncbi:MAG: response regulator [Flavobacterium sp.]|nr:MAG: response regulator [Flavobacterium sp.]